VPSIPTPDQVRSLAPDGSAARAGEALANARRWSGTGRDDRAAWGLCQGSGASPYQVTVDFTGPAFRCTCPSRKFPCKHGLAILFLLSADPSAFPPAEPPGWAAEWLTSRAERAEAAEVRTQARLAWAESGAPPTDAAARDRRIEARERKVQAGIVDLDRWLQDLVRRGLASVKGEGYRFWDQAGARLVDAQAAALGREVRALGATFNSGAGWAEWALERVGRLHLIVEAYRRIDSLPPDLRHDVRGLVGWTIKEDELPRGGAVSDRWVVVGRTVTGDERLTTARTWLLGEATGRFALHLAFGAGGANPVPIGLPGSSFRASLVYYPSATPLRIALSSTPEATASVETFPEAWTLSVGGAARAFTDVLARNPFVTSWPAILEAVVPVGRGGHLYLRDGAGATILVRPGSIAARLVAVAGGRPMTAFGSWTGTGFRVLSAVTEGRIVDLGTDNAEVTDDADQDAGLGANRSTDGSPWGQLVSSALLGTERVELPDVEVAGAAALARRPAEARLLAMVGVVASTRKAGYVPGTDDGIAPEPAPSDPRPIVSPNVAWILKHTIEDWPELLVEWLNLCAARERRPPDDELPRLLGQAARNVDVRDALAPLIGPRARWLIDQMPELAAGVTRPAGDPAEAWESAGTPTARAAVIAEIRTADPRAARELLEASWTDLTTQDRVLTLVAMATSLGPDDEPFLERALGDSRAEVRSVAVDRLVTLPGSALAKLAEETARPVLAAVGRARPSLAVEPPSEWTDDLARLAIPRKPPHGVGERSWWLRQLIARIPPARWVTWLGEEPAGLIARARRTDEANAILRGWIEATLHFRDAGWAEAILSDREIVANGSEIHDPLALLDILGPSPRDAAAARLIRVLDKEQAANIAERVPGPWSGQFERPILDVLRKEGPLVSKAFVDLVRLAVRRMSTARADELEAIVALDGSRLLSYPIFNQYLDAMRFRQRMAAAFAAMPAPERGTD
jgi:Family of unknown function (DUF5691)/SWIM zinc finger